MMDDAAQQQGGTQSRDAQEAQDGQARGLGLLRWVQVAYMVFFVTSLWLLDKIATLVWKLFDEPNPTAVTGIAVVIAGAVTFALHRHEKANRITHEVVGELAKVTWPSRRETTSSSVVVVVTSVIAAAILGGFDAAWSAITDLIYKV